MGMEGFPDRLRDAIHSKGWSIKKFHASLQEHGVESGGEKGKIAGASYPMVYKYLQGKAEPSAAFVAAAAEVLNVSVEWLWLGRGDSSPKSPSDDLEMDFWWTARHTGYYALFEVFSAELDKPHRGVVFDREVDRGMWAIGGLIADLTLTYDYAQSADEAEARQREFAAGDEDVFWEAADEVEGSAGELARHLLAPLQYLPLAGSTPSRDDVREYLTLSLMAMEALMRRARENALKTGIRRLVFDEAGPDQEHIRKMVERYSGRRERIEAQRPSPSSALIEDEPVDA